MDESCKWEPTLNSVALGEAVLCADCEIISNSGGETCEICGSRSLLSVSRVLGGCIEGERAKLIDADPNRLRNGFTVLVNPGAATILQWQRRRRNGSS
ncbi:MAG TPA: hypothetical protein VKV05_08640 [Terriglobales bacterium]|nr:hypothetical protein [Terriglobales bacterium]